MKNIKRFAAIVLAFVMIFSFAQTALAEGTNNGEITINNATVGQEYTIYRIFDLESYNGATNAYSYTVTPGWENFVNSVSIKDVYVTVENGYVKWVGGLNNEDPQTFAQLALEYAKTAANNITAVATQTPTTDGTITFSGLKLGYYLVDSTVGTLCALDTTNPNMTVDAKNMEPTIEKKVEEDLDGGYNQRNDADIKQTINFRTTIVVQAGAQNYVMHDKMSEGLTFIGVSKVTHTSGGIVTDVATDHYTVASTGLTDDCTFEVAFTNDWIKTLEPSDVIYVYYTAELNENAVIGSAGNPNESVLSYGENGDLYTEPDTTTTHTWEVNVFKYTDDNGTEVPLSGAEFVLKTKFKDDHVRYAVVDANGKIAGWTLNKDNGNIVDSNNNNVVDKDENYTATATDTPILASKLISAADGYIRIQGLDGATTYYLEETAPPPGYNQLKGDVQFTITKDGIVIDNTSAVLTGNIVKVLNRTGSELPTTGGMGTTIIYTIGAILVLGSVILLITKRRMKAN